MTPFDVLKRAAVRLFAQSVRQTRTNRQRFAPALTELERRETPAGPDWLSDLGIQSAGLGLTGKDIGIGQMEIGRPGKANFDAKWNKDVTPAEVMTLGKPPAENDATTSHATSVAGAIIRKNSEAAGGLPRTRNCLVPLCG